jgi:hypothetical protein
MVMVFFFFFVLFWDGKRTCSLTSRIGIIFKALFMAVNPLRNQSQKCKN